MVKSVSVMLLLIGATSMALPALHLAHATGTLYVSPSLVALKPVGSVFTVKVQVANMDPFNGWDIAIMTNQTVINATSLSTTVNTLVANYSFTKLFELENCVNGRGTGCNSDADGIDGPGIVHSIYAAKSPLAGQLPPGPYNGLLFTINYTVVGSSSYSTIHFLSGQSYPVLTNPNRVDIGSPLDGTYGTKPIIDFDMTPPNPASLSIVKGSNANSTITISSIGGYSGFVNLTWASSTNGLSIALNSTRFALTATHPSEIIVTVSSNASTAAVQYAITVIGTSGSLSHQVTVTVLVNDTPDFILSVSPSIIEIHATYSGSSTVTLDTQSDFSGSIQLSLSVPPVPGLNASLGSTNLRISPHRPATTILAIRTPPSDLPFVYYIYVIASSQSSTHAPFKITVENPPPDFSFKISGLSGVQAGQSRTFTLMMTSLDYFKGRLFLLATSLSGAKEVFTRPAVALDFGNSSTSSMTINTDVSLAPGNHNVTLTALGTTFQGVSVNHAISMILTVTKPPQQTASVTILGLQPAAYFALIGVLWIIVVGATIREVKKPKPKRFLG